MIFRLHSRHSKVTPPGATGYEGVASGLKANTKHGVMVLPSADSGSRFDNLVITDRWGRSSRQRFRPRRYAPDHDGGAPDADPLADRAPVLCGAAVIPRACREQPGAPPRQRADLTAVPPLSQRTTGSCRRFGATYRAHQGAGQP